MTILDLNIHEKEDVYNNLKFLNIDMLHNGVVNLENSIKSLYKIANVDNKIDIFVDQDKYQSSTALIGNINYSESLTLDCLEPLLVYSIKCVVHYEDVRALRFIESNPPIVTYVVNGKFFALSKPTIWQVGKKVEYNYLIEGIITGLVLPHYFELTEIEYVDLSFDRIANIINDTATLSSTIEKNKVDYVNEIRKANKSIELKGLEYKSILKTIEVALAEKTRVEESNNETMALLDRVNNDVEHSHEKLKEIEDAIKTLANQEAVDKEKFNLFKINVGKEIDSVLKTSEENKKICDATEEKLHNLKVEVSDAERNLNLYTFDMQGFDKESKYQLKKYYIGVGILLLMLFTIFSFMYFSAKSFSELIDTSWKVSTWDILLSRLPLFTATALIIGTFSALLFFLVNHIISLNSDKMNMLKASILAEQITATLGCEQTMTPEQVVELKRNTKIELLLKVFSPKESTKISTTSEQVDVLAKLLDILKPKS
ncbi:hypothetical protein [Shewanella sp. M-Br]|uniref:hypothetical protein n=1 Tax=Shewanella sp. M-Br TaxID=2495595 RepID=UPI002949137D|nr:hypothetical protein SMBr_00010 [Shewanella sp. M-Br]